MLSIPKPDREAIGKAWLERILESYPAQTSLFLGRERDRFRNPIGHALREKVPVLADELLGTMDLERITGALDALVRIRAVQDFTPGQALGFLFELRPIVRRQWHGQSVDWDELNRRIEQTALLGFDLYMSCREKILEVQIEEARRRTAQLERIYSGDESR